MHSDAPAPIVIPLLDDNYAYILADGAGGAVVVDPGDSEPVARLLESLGLPLSAILCTHHHGDHIAGVEALRSRSGCTVWGPDDDRIPGIDRRVGGGAEIPLAGGIRVLATPGHGSHDLSYWLPAASALFSGDTLFVGGCGRLFEGTPSQMWRSLQRLMALPGETRVYCGHEYTLDNVRFALSLEPGNQALHERLLRVQALRARGEPSVPVTMAEEIALNPFLRAADPAFAAGLGLAGHPPEAVFAEIRRQKDGFRC